MSAIKAQPVPDNLIPAINIIRKIKVCDSLQLSKVLQRLPALFEGHGLLSSLTSIVSMGVCQHLHRQPLSPALLLDILGILPADNELEIKDTVYESKLVDHDDDEQKDEKNSSTDHKKEKIPMSLIRIPRDLQIHLFHFVELKDLQNVQKVCRALCIVARNPLSLRSLSVELDSIGCPQFRANCYSKIKRLSVFRPTYVSPTRLIFNANWSRSVTKLSLCSVQCAESHSNPNQSFYFQNLEHCSLSNSISCFSLVQSYEPLKDLDLFGCNLDDNLVDQLCKFQNLEKLSLSYIRCSDESSTPIKLDSLRELYFAQYCSNRLVHRILIGSRPSTVTIKIDKIPWTFDTALNSDVLAELRGIKNINFMVVSFFTFVNLLNQDLLPILAETQHKKCKLFEKCCVDIHFGRKDDICDKDKLPLIVKLFQYAQSSKLNLSYISTPLQDTPFSRLIRDHFVEVILDAPVGTFTEIALNLEFRPCVWVNDQEFWNLFYHRDSAVDLVGFRKYILNIFQEKDKCLEPWLALDEDTMKRVGMKSIDIGYKCGLRFDHGDDESDTAIDLDDLEFIGEVRAAWQEIAAQILETRVKHWTTRNKRYSADCDCRQKWYTVKIQTESKLQVQHDDLNTQ